MSDITEYNAVFRVLQEIANALKKSNQSIFEIHLSKLLELHELIKSKKNHRIVNECLNLLQKKVLNVRFQDLEPLFLRPKMLIMIYQTSEYYTGKEVGRNKDKRI